MGHTIAHAVETETGYTRYRHGEAVAVGMVGAAYISEEMGLLAPEERARIEALLCGVGLPLCAEGVAPDAMYADPFHDKKTVGGRLHWVLAKGSGSPEVRAGVPEETVRRALAKIVKGP